MTSEVPAPRATGIMTLDEEDAKQVDTAGGSTYGDIACRTAVLDNGLRVVVYEDRTRPLVATHLGFDVGSKNEPAGRTGFAHIFEHLMFKGTRARPGSWHHAIEEIGGSGANGATSTDTTTFYQVVPTGALDTLLWMEADRMGDPLGGLDDAAFASEVDVIRNEKRQREGAPYGLVFETTATTLYPRDHPYGHSVIGSVADLDGATLAAATAWHRDWYGAANAVLTLSGDVSFDEVVAKVEQRFGHLPAGSAPTQLREWVPADQGERTTRMFDRVPHPSLRLVWQTPGARHADAVPLQFVASVLGATKGRLTERLVDGDGSCLSVTLGQESRMLCGEFTVMAMLADGADADAVAAIVREEVARFAAEDGSPAELERARRLDRLGFARSNEDIASVAQRLGMATLMHDRPEAYRRQIAVADALRMDDLRRVSAKWLGAPALRLDILPRREVRRTEMPTARRPAPSSIAAARFPAVSRGHLSNGTPVLLAHRPGGSSVSVGLWLDRGRLAEPRGLEGLSALTQSSLQLGEGARDRATIARLIEDHGIGAQTSVSTYTSSFALSVPPASLSTALDLLAGLIFRPLFPEPEVTKLLARARAGAAAGAHDAARLAASLSIKKSYGPDHPFSRPQPTPESIARIDAAIMRAHHHELVSSAHRTLAFVGDLTLSEAMAVAEPLFGRSPLPPRGRIVAASDIAPQPGLYGIALPDREQSALSICTATAAARPGNPAMSILNQIVGGGFSSRLNSALRERRGWTYGLATHLEPAPGIGSFRISTAVDARHAVTAVAQIGDELAALAGSRPVTIQEVEHARQGFLAAASAQWGNNAAVLSGLDQQLAYGLPDGFFDGAADRLRAVTLDDVVALAEEFGRPDRYAWGIAGDPVGMPAGTLVQDGGSEP